MINPLKLEQVEVLSNGMRDHIASIHVDFPVSKILLTQVVTILDSDSGVVCGTKFERAHMKCAQMNPELNNRQGLGLCAGRMVLPLAAQAQVDRKSDPIVKNPFNVAVTEISTSRAAILTPFQSEEDSQWQPECQVCENNAVWCERSNYYWCGGKACEAIIQSALVSSERKMRATGSRKRRMDAEIHGHVVNRRKLQLLGFFHESEEDSE